MPQRSERLVWNVLICGAVALSALPLASRTYDRHHDRFHPDLFGPREAATALSATIVFQAADCESRLDFLRIFRRPDVRRTVGLQRLVAIDGSRRAPAVTKWHGDAFADVPLVPLDPAARRVLEQLGYRRTPLVVIADGDGRIHYVADGPRAGEETVRFVRLLAQLAPEPQ